MQILAQVTGHHPLEKLTGVYRHTDLAVGRRALVDNGIAAVDHTDVRWTGAEQLGPECHADRDLFELPEDEGTEQPLEPPAASRLAEIKVPTLVVVGDCDVEEILMAADFLAEGIPGAQKAVIPGVAHYPNMERPTEFNRVVLDFLAL